MKKLHTPLLAIALSALLVSVSYADANDDQIPSNDIIDSTVTDSPFADSFNTVEDESANASTTGASAYIHQAVTNSDLSLDGNAFQDATGFNITNASGNSIVGSSSNVNANESTTAFDDAITSNDISSDATATATADVGNTVITQTSTLTQSYTQN
jgi:hypothetical protein